MLLTLRRPVLTSSPRIRPLIAALVACALLITACATDEAPADQSPTPGPGQGAAELEPGDVLPAVPLSEEEDPGLVHVHGLGVNPADGALMIATHFGLWRMEGDGDAERVGEYYHDLMGFTVIGADHFVASGHPLLVGGDLPPLLGLLETTDGGETWRSVSLLGEVDFHALRADHDLIWGWNSADGRFMTSPDGAEWETRSTQAGVIDFVVSPDDPNVVLATVARSREEVFVQRSEDGGASWAEVESTPPLARLTWTEGARLVGVGPDGEVWTSADAGATWEERGDVGGFPEALLDDGQRLVTSVTGTVSASNDDGRSWRELHQGH